MSGGGGETNGQRKVTRFRAEGGGGGGVSQLAWAAEQALAQAVAQEAAGWKMSPAASVAPWAGGPNGVAQLPLLGCWKVYGMVLTAVSKPCRSCRRSGVEKPEAALQHEVRTVVGG